MSTETKHTAEPWTITQDNESAIEVTDDRGGLVLREEFNFEDPIYLKAGTRAQIHRAVACVNACAGMEDPAKAIHKAIGLLETIRARSEASGDPFEALCAADAINVLGGYRDYLPPKP